jgi:Sulfotransferase domain
MESEIIIVSGLPRSGTSLMMQMLDRGGMPVLTDHIRAADPDNPKGYYELEQVKKVKEDSSWLPKTRGKVFKMVSQLLYELPTSERYRIIFMERDLDEVLVSQDKMLKRLKKTSDSASDIKRSFEGHLQRLHDWLSHQANIQVLYVNYNELMNEPGVHAARISEFLAGKPDAQKMAHTVDPSLYRNRKRAGDHTDEQ